MFFDKLTKKRWEVPKKVNHDIRKLEILKAAIKVFGREGFENSNLSIIAQECNLSRATIYQYFKNKDEVFYFAIKEATENMFAKYNIEIWNSEIHPIDAIQLVVDDIMDTALLHKKELSNLIRAIGKLKGNLNKIIYRRTAKLQILIKQKIREGIKNNQIIEISPVEFTNQMIIFIESFCFQMAYFPEENVNTTRNLIHKYLQSTKK